MQVLLQMIVTKVNFAVYICNAESGAAWIMYCPETIRDDMETSLVQVSNGTCGWEYTTTTIPGFAIDDDSRMLLTRLPPR